MGPAPRICTPASSDGLFRHRRQMATSRNNDGRERRARGPRGSRSPGPVAPARRCGPALRSGRLRPKPFFPPPVGGAPTALQVSRPYEDLGAPLGWDSIRWFALVSKAVPRSAAAEADHGAEPVLVERRGVGSDSASLPMGRRGARRGDDRRVICGIVHMLRAGARRRDCPAEYGPYTTAYNRFTRWSRQGAWEDVFHILAGTSGSVGTTSADSAHTKAHRSASGAKGGLGQRHRPLSRRTDDQASRPDRRSRPPSGAEPDAGPSP